MSKKNRERRGADRRRAAQRPGADGARRAQPRASGRRDGFHQPPLADLIQAAIDSSGHDELAHTVFLDALERRGAVARDALRGLTTEAVRALWDRGWTPRELHHAMARMLSLGHAQVVAAAAVEDLAARAAEPVDDRWRAQVEELVDAAGAAARADVGLLVGLLAMLRRLPAVACIVPPPGRAPAGARGTSSLDPALLHKVRMLLAKAESTEFTAEAEALTEKAQELIARHAIDEALLEAGASGPGPGSGPAHRRVLFDNPYADANAVLVSELARANRCRSVYCAEWGWCALIGYPEDLDAVELLVASLLTQATAAMARHGSRRDSAGRSSTRSFRRAFLYGFANRIGERLRATTAAQVGAVAASNDALLPVLASRDARVRDAMQEAFPRVVTKASSLSNASGYSAGRVAAERARLDVGSAAVRG